MHFIMRELLGDIWCSYPEYLNDPFDGLGSVATDEVAKPCKPGCSAKIVRRAGIACFSTKWDSATMWSHYAAGATGVCIGYDAKKIAALEGSVVPEPSDAQISQAYRFETAFAPVKYVRDLPEHPSESIEAAFYKSAEWEYESEWRLVYKTPIMNLVPAGGNLLFTTDCITEILVGYRVDAHVERALVEYIQLIQAAGSLGRVSYSKVGPSSDSRRYVRGWSRQASFDKETQTWR